MGQTMSIITRGFSQSLNTVKDNKFSNSVCWTVGSFINCQFNHISVIGSFEFHSINFSHETTTAQNTA